MDGDPFTRQVDVLRSQNIEVRPCLEGQVTRRHETLLESLHILATTAEVQFADERAGRLYDASAGELHVATSFGLPDEYLARVARLGLGGLCC